MIDEKQLNLLEQHGWVIECQNPLEIHNENLGAHANGVAAEILIDALIGHLKPIEFEDIDLKTIGEDNLRFSWHLGVGYKANVISTANGRTISYTVEIPKCLNRAIYNVIKDSDHGTE